MRKLIALLPVVLLANACDTADIGSDSSGTGATSDGASNAGERCTLPASEYSQCVRTSCEAEQLECYGDVYASGTCGPQVLCTSKCGTEARCNEACIDPACTACGAKVRECISANCESCRTCAELETCCSKLTDATKKRACSAHLDAVRATGSRACDAVFAVFAADCP